MFLDLINVVASQQKKIKILSIIGSRSEKYETNIHFRNNFLKSLANKKNKWENIKADMALKGLNGKNYIHSIGKWGEYIKYLNKSLKL